MGRNYTKLNSRDEISSINKSLNDSNKNICERFRGFKCDKLGLENANSFSLKLKIPNSVVNYLTIHIFYCNFVK